MGAQRAVLTLHTFKICRSDHHACVAADPDVGLPHVMDHELPNEVVEVRPNHSGWGRRGRVTAPFILGWGGRGDCATRAATACNR
ncbi:MAG: alcohol dehydrogenase catalytic domain-containing protein [Pseudomonadota bacterium]